MTQPTAEGRDSDDILELGLPEALEPVAEATPQERRMNLRAYQLWDSLLAGRTMPALADLDPRRIDEFRDNSVLIDFTGSSEHPVLRYVGALLRSECGLSLAELRPQDVPGRSLLSRLTDHYLEIMANRAPVGFEAEFVSAQGAPTLYRGILLPFSDDGQIINFIYGVINWKVDTRIESPAQAEGPGPAPAAGAPLELAPSFEEPLELASPLDEPLDLADLAVDGKPANDRDERAVAVEDALDLSDALRLGAAGGGAAPDFASVPDFASALDDAYDEPLPVEALIEDAGTGADDPAATAAPVEEPLDLGAMRIDEEALSELGALLGVARAAAARVESADGRSRTALYEALARAYDLALAAEVDPTAYQSLLAAAGLALQARAPHTPVVKLVFGATYDKTRVTEYAAAMSFARREHVPPGSFQTFIEAFDGGLKGLVQAERSNRAAAKGNIRIDHSEMLRDVVRQSTALASVPLAAVSPSAPVESEFVVLVARRRGGQLEVVHMRQDSEAVTAAVRVAARDLRRAARRARQTRTAD